VPSGGRFRFDRFELDLQAKSLTCDGVPIPLAAIDIELLGAFVKAPGIVLTKDQLIEATWRGPSVGYNSLEKGLVRVRRALDADNHERYIETARRAGYCFTASVSRDDDADAEIAPHRAFIEGRAWLQTFRSDDISKARAALERALARRPYDATIHVGLANAYWLEYERTRADATPDKASLNRAYTHAMEARRLAPDYAEAHCTLGVILDRMGRRDEGLAALDRGVKLEPHRWVHHFRLTLVAWGDDRLRAAHDTIAKAGECPLARVLAAMVYVARAHRGDARREIHLGLAEAGDINDDSPYSVVALDWISGLLYFDERRDDDALRAWRRELAREPRGHLYARECAANVWYAIGAYHLRRGEKDDARAAFEEALSRVPLHAVSHAGLLLLEPADRRGSLSAELPRTMELAIAHAILLVDIGETAKAVQLLLMALDMAPPGNAGWIIPIEPLLYVSRDPEMWAPVLSKLKKRAL